jgi:hypothetical protein
MLCSDRRGEAPHLAADKLSLAWVIVLIGVLVVAGCSAPNRSNSRDGS